MGKGFSFGLGYSFLNTHLKTRFNQWNFTQFSLRIAQVPHTPKDRYLSGLSKKIGFPLLLIVTSVWHSFMFRFWLKNDVSNKKIQKFPKILNFHSIALPTQHTCPFFVSTQNPASYMTVKNDSQKWPPGMTKNSNNASILKQSISGSHGIEFYGQKAIG